MIEHQKLATLLQAFSVAFAYPTDNLFGAIQNGDLVQVLKEEVTSLPNEDELQELIQQLETGITPVLDKGLQELESDYIALFEVNREQAPVHMYAHLFIKGGDDRISAMKRLQGLYQQFGLKIKEGGEGDHPDHLVIQLEFMAYLLRQLDETDPDDHEQYKMLQTASEHFSQEFVWIPDFVKALDQHPHHAFYTQLAFLMSKVVSNLSESLNYSS